MSIYQYGGIGVDTWTHELFFFSIVNFCRFMYTYRPGKCLELDTYEYVDHARSDHISRIYIGAGSHIYTRQYFFTSSRTNFYLNDVSADQRSVRSMACWLYTNFGSWCFMLVWLALYLARRLEMRQGTGFRLSTNFAVTQPHDSVYLSADTLW